MNTLATDTKKATEQLVEIQRTTEKDRALWDFFRGNIGSAFSPCAANVNVLTHYIGEDQPWTVNLLEQAVSFISDKLAEATDNSRQMIRRQDREREEAEEAARLASIASGNAALLAMNKSQLRAELRRQQELKNQSKSVVLTNPATGVEYTRRELLALSAPEIKKLLLYPNHQSKPPEYKAAFDRILATEQS